MKKTLIAMLCSLPLAASGQKEVVMHFNLRNVQQNDTLTLSWGANNKSVTPLITTVLPTETPEITLPLNEPRLVVLSVKGQTEGKEILLSPGEDVTVSGRLRSGSRYQFDKLRIKGAERQWEYSEAMRYYKMMSDSLDDQMKSEFKDVIRQIENNKTSRNEQGIANVYMTKRGRDYVERVISIYNERNEIVDDIIYQHKETFMGPLLMIRLMGRLSKANRDMYNSLSDAAKLSYYGREVKDEVYPPTLIGDIAPTVTVQDTDGNEKVLSFTSHGAKYLLLDFWASWCEPCHKEIPNLRALYDRYHDQGLEIIGISADQNPEDWKSCLEEQKEPWANYLDRNRQAIGEYKVQYIPSIFIIDENGTIIAEKLRGRELAEFIFRLFMKRPNMGN